MARPKNEDRGTVATETLTLRLTLDERRLLDELVKRRAEELADDGATLTAASYVRALIRKDAKARGLGSSETPKTRPKKK